jgi:hypothetical protein
MAAAPMISIAAGVFRKLFTRLPVYLLGKSRGRAADAPITGSVRKLNLSQNRAPTAGENL